MDYHFERESFTTYSKGVVAIIRIKSKVFDLVTDLEESELMLDFIKKTEYDPQIMALLIINEPGCYGEDVYEQFMHKILELQPPEDNNANPNFIQKNTRFREINILNKIVKGTAEYQKLSFIGIDGDIVTPFFGAALSADFRFASKGSKIIMAHKKYGLHPSGALPFFLGRYLGHSKAIEFQLSDIIKVKKAMELGLINEIFETDEFEKLCLIGINNYLHCKTCTMRRTKQLTSFVNRDLNDYFQFEASLLNL
ncbi:MAG: enoyl-CoA hydratase/isomerase family protein [Bacteroidetes bacterium]|nr:enoyl-CoA hydratase/isomerase family protein [Bacteroidota bacterium]